MFGDEGRMLGQARSVVGELLMGRRELANQSGGLPMNGHFGAGIKEKVTAPHSIRQGSCSEKKK